MTQHHLDCEKQPNTVLSAALSAAMPTHVLTIDELAYLSDDNRNADLLFQVISRRYERKSIVLTTNLNFSDWPSIFPNAICTTALLDRISHHADIIAIERESYRRREAQVHKAKRTKKKMTTDSSEPDSDGPTRLRWVKFLRFLMADNMYQYRTAVGRFFAASTPL